MCVCMCVCVCPAMCFVVLCELKLGRMLGNELPSLWSSFQSDLAEGQRFSRGQAALEMAYGHQIW